MSTQVDYVVAGLGALGSAAAYELAGRGHSVVGLERFELGHTHGASHDTSRILRHSYHTPAYVRLTQDAYADWARLERASGRSLVTKVGGLDLFPPHAAIPPSTTSTRSSEVGIEHEVLDAAAVAARWPQFRPGERRDGALPARRRDRAGRARHPDDAGAGDEATAPSCGRTARSPVCTTWGSAGSRSRPRRARSAAAGSWSARTPGSTTSLGHLGRAGAGRGDARAGHLLPAGGAGALRAGADAAVDLDGRPVATTASRATARRRSRPRRTAAGPIVDPDGADVGAATRRWSSASPRSWATCCRAAAQPVRSSRCQYTLTPDRDFVIAPVPGHESVVVGLGRRARVQVRADVRPAARRPGRRRRRPRPTSRTSGWTARP